MRSIAATYIFFGLFFTLTGCSPVDIRSAQAARSRRSPYRNNSFVAYGTPIWSCTVPGTVALTFDDGPYIYTAQVLDTLAANGVQATFFINGQNWGNIYQYTDVIHRIVNEGHQIGSHTWSHADLTTLNYAGIASELTQLSNALKSILGYYPQYMRPPYFASNGLVSQVLRDLGYHEINADIDTLDYENDSWALIQNSVDNFVAGLDAGGSIQLGHDVHEWTANILVQAMIDEVRRRGLTPVTVGQCLGDAPENWYRT